MYLKYNVRIVSPNLIGKPISIIDYIGNNNNVTVIVQDSDDTADDTTLLSDTEFKELTLGNDLAFEHKSLKKRPCCQTPVLYTRP